MERPLGRDHRLSIQDGTPAHGIQVGGDHVVAALPQMVDAVTEERAVEGKRLRMAHHPEDC